MCFACGYQSRTDDSGSVFTTRSCSPRQTRRWPAAGRTLSTCSSGTVSYLGRIPIPDGFSLRVVTESALYGVWEDDLEVPFARRYRVIRAAAE